MKNNWYSFIDFPIFDSKNGILTMIQGNSVKAEKKLPFDVKRILVMKDMKTEAVRGGHTHHKTRQVLFALTGGCTVELDNGKEKQTVKLDNFSRGVLLEPYVWHVMKDFKAQTTLLVVADTEYDESEYIRDYETFKKIAINL